MYTLHHLCNLQCSYCYQRNTPFSYQPLDTSILKRFPDKKIWFEILGGEPFCTVDVLLRELEKVYSFSNVVKIPIGTNGLLMLPHLEKFLEYKDKIVFTVTFHAEYAEQYYKPNFIEAIKFLQDNGIEYNITYLNTHKTDNIHRQFYEEVVKPNNFIFTGFYMYDENHTIVNRDVVCPYNTCDYYYTKNGVKKPLSKYYDDISQYSKIICYNTSFSVRNNDLVLSCIECRGKANKPIVHSCRTKRCICAYEFLTYKVGLK